MNANLLNELEQSQKNLLGCLHSVPANDSYKQYRDDLSPIAWHVGHCAFIEEYWIREVVGGDNTVTEPLKTLYFPERSQKDTRSRRMPPRPALIEFTTNLFKQHLHQLRELIDTSSPHRLLKDNYLLRFLLQHSTQHQEILMQTLYQRALQKYWPHLAKNKLAAKDYSAPQSEFASCSSEFGNVDSAEAYDNERPVTQHVLAAFSLGQRSANNAEYLGFMNAKGYQRKSFWSLEGWQWLQKEKADCPEHWRKDAHGDWIAITHHGAQDLAPNDAVYGLSRYEAEAFAAYAGGRLPHEFEWEVAVDLPDQHREQAWDWCRNSFFPYPNYRPYPYDGYSRSWFDGNHYTLRGASVHTGASIRRTSFRNFYTPDKRHVFAGVRVAYDR